MRTRRQRPIGTRVGGTAADGLVPNVLVTPVSIILTQGDTLPSYGYAPGKLIDGSGAVVDADGGELGERGASVGGRRDPLGARTLRAVRTIPATAAIRSRSSSWTSGAATT